MKIPRRMTPRRSSRFAAMVGAAALVTSLAACSSGPQGTVMFSAPFRDPYNYYQHPYAIAGIDDRGIGLDPVAFLGVPLEDLALGHRFPGARGHNLNRRLCSHELCAYDSSAGTGRDVPP